MNDVEFLKGLLYFFESWYSDKWTKLGKTKTKNDLFLSIRAELIFH